MFNRLNDVVIMMATYHAYGSWWTKHSHTLYYKEWPTLAVKILQ